MTMAISAFSAEEDDLLAILKSEQSLQAKDAACSRLKWIGTAASIPILAELLTDRDLSHSARYALESMPGPAAEKALLEALPKTTGTNQAGIILCLGVRGDAAAAPVLARFLSTDAPKIAVAAAEALGEIGGPEACQTLKSAWENSVAGPAHDAQTGGLLACASQKSGNALQLFQEIYNRETNGEFRLAAYRGLILASGSHGADLMVKAIAGADPDAQSAALQLASTLGGRKTTKELAALLPGASLAVQVALLQGLDQRRDTVAESQVLSMLGNQDPTFRLAALETVGDIGGRKAVLPVATLAAQTTGPERNAARETLVNLRQGSVAREFVELLDKTSGNVRAELIRALGDRGDSTAAGKILQLAAGSDDSVRPVCLQALASLAGPAQVSGMIGLVTRANNDDARSDAADALTTACERMESKSAPLDAGELARTAQTASVEARVAILGVCSVVRDPRIRDVLRQGMLDSAPRIHEAAMRAVCNSQDDLLLPDILKVACGAKEENFRLLAIGGCVRLITQEEGAKITPSEKLAALKSILGTSLNVQGKRLVLSGLASVADLQSLDLAKGLLDDPEVKVEAQEATVQIARAVAAEHPAKAAAALRLVLDQKPDDGVRKTAQAALKKIKKTE